MATRHKLPLGPNPSVKRRSETKHGADATGLSVSLLRLSADRGADPHLASMTAESSVATQRHKLIPAVANQERGTS
jgi:hypothetical protein